jgi:cellulose synthase operon protein C
MNGGGDWTPDVVQRKLRSLRTPEESHRDWPLRASAAMVYSFDPATLQPAGPLLVGREEALAQLLRDCALVSKPGGPPEYSLQSGARQQALARLGTRDAIRAALDANIPKADDTFQRVLTNYLLGEAVPLEQQTPEELRTTGSVLALLEGLIDGLPSREEVRRAIEFGSLIDWLQRIAGPNFSGRQRELEYVGEYVGSRPPSTISSQMRRSMRTWFPERQRSPLMIYGPGGVGKTALVAKIILDGLSDGEAQLPFAYLSLDRPSVGIEEPAAVLAEIVGQLGGQFPSHHRVFEKARDEWLKEDVGPADALVSNFSEILEATGLGGRPFLLVLDSLDEIQYRGTGYVEMLERLLAALQANIPRLRPVLISRVKVTQFPTDDLQIREFDGEAADAFLERRGIAESGIRQALVRAIGGNPLSLSLAAELAQREGEEGFLETALPSRLFWAEDGAVQGALFKRILNHINDEEIRRLVPAALVLRQFSPELIHEVLAPACGLEVADVIKAQGLFATFRHEVTLVVPAERGSLRFRTDVRRAVLPLLRHEEPARVRRIHSSAAEYYAMQEDLEAKAEGLYHLLSLDAEPSALESHWWREAGPYLETSLEELPSRARSWLVSKLAGGG